MIRLLVSTVAATALLATSALAEIPEPPATVVSYFANGCSANEAYGFALAEPYAGNRFVGLDDSLMPFRSMEVFASLRSNRLVSVSVDAHHGEEAGTLDERKAAALALMNAVDHAVGETGQFPVRDQDEENHIISWSDLSVDGASGVRFEIFRRGAGVYLTCLDVAMEALAWREATGRARIERPVPPALHMPPPLDTAECNHPGRAEGVLDAFWPTDARSLMEAALAGQGYLADLRQWYGQEMIDKGAWLESEADEFETDMFNDPEFATEFEQRMELVAPLMESLAAYAERTVARDGAGACRAALPGLDILRSVIAADANQRIRTTSSYQAEAQRLGVTLD